MIHKATAHLETFFTGLGFPDLVHFIEEEESFSSFTILVEDAFGQLWPLRFFSRDDSTNVKCVVFGIAQIPDAVRTAVLEKINEFGDSCFVKLFIDKENELVATSDIFYSASSEISEDALGELALEALLRMTHFFRERYPELHSIIHTTPRNDLAGYHALVEEHKAKAASEHDPHGIDNT